MPHVKWDSAGAGQPFLSNAAASPYGILLIVKYNARSQVRYNRTDNLFQTCGPATHVLHAGYASSHPVTQQCQS